MIQHVPPLVDLATLDDCRLASVLLHRSRERLSAIQNVEPRWREIEPALQQIAQQLSDYRRVFRRSLPDAQDRFPPVFTDAQRCYHLLSRERRRIDQQSAQPDLIQLALHYFLEFGPAGFDEMLTDGAL